MAVSFDLIDFEGVAGGLLTMPVQVPAGTPLLIVAHGAGGIGTADMSHDGPEALINGVDRHTSTLHAVDIVSKWWFSRSTGTDPDITCNMTDMSGLGRECLFTWWSIDGLDPDAILLGPVGEAVFGGTVSPYTPTTLTGIPPACVDVAFIGCDAASGFTTPAGWSLAPYTVGGGFYTAEMYYRERVALEVAPTFVFSGSPSLLHYETFSLRPAPPVFPGQAILV